VVADQELIRNEMTIDAVGIAFLQEQLRLHALDVPLPPLIRNGQGGDFRGVRIVDANNAKLLSTAGAPTDSNPPNSHCCCTLDHSCNAAHRQTRYLTGVGYAHPM
jgi:hypothetical protein